jgi:F0F1-type ATP synthase epsilon subunit
MGLTLHIDTLKFARALKEAGADERLAEAIAGGFASVDTSEFATKTDIAELKSEIAEVRAANRADIAELKSEIADSFKELYRHLWIMGASIVGLIVAIDKLFP